MRRIASVACLVLGLSTTPTLAQTITVTAPTSGANAVASANDFATQAFQDPWDMSERSDPGWWLHSVDIPSNGFSGVSFGGGVFSGTIAPNSVPNLWLLETGLPNVPPIGKTGAVFPINANLYRIFAIRMWTPNDGQYMLFHWGTNTMYDGAGLSVSNAVLTTPGWRIYFVDLATLGLITGTEPWNGTKRALRLHPTQPNAAAGGQLQIDWVRLVDDQPALFRNVTWTGGGPVNIYLDNDSNAANGNLGPVALNVSGSSYSLNAGALAPGNYFVAIQRTSGGSTAYSPGFYQVNAPATLTVMSPSEEGSADEFATTQLNDPWDMTSATDIDHTINLSSAGIAAIPNAETESGTSLGTIVGLFGTSAVGDFSNPSPCAQFAKPVVYPLHRNVRGALHHIDPAKYRILTAEIGLPNKARDLCNGSIVRVVWHVAGEVQETYSWGISLNSRAGANVVNKLNFDMAALPIEPDSPGQMGWTAGASPFPGIQSLRIDPHEFANPTSFYIKSVKLAAFETAHTSYTVRWTSSKTGGTVRVYYDTDKDPSSKIFIGSTAASSVNGSLVWNTSGQPHGAEYFVYVEFDDGANVNGTYSKWPVRIDHSGASTARLVLNRPVLNFGIAAGTIKTPQQLLRLSVVNANAGTPCWSVTSDLSFVTVTPSSGCGSATLTVSLVNQTYHGSGDFSGYLRVSSSGVINSPQYTQTVVRVLGATTAPSGMIDTPANGATVTGSVPVTGWAVDDVGISRVTVCRSPVTGEQGGHPACGPNQVYLGDAVMIEDARPDVQAVSPTTPFNYRAGWGFMVLTNMLPNQGVGNFTFHANAFDLDGRFAALGSKNVTARNDLLTEPFGAIDTPGQGETISGSYANFGWVLSRVRRADPPGGGAVTVYIDGVGVGSPVGWNQRADLTAAFPGYPGLSTALGVYGINSTQYANGLHTIAWVVSDSAGVTSGVGSRFFSIFNTGSSVTEAAMRPIGPDLGRRDGEVALKASEAPILMRAGFSTLRSMQTVKAGVSGRTYVRAPERDRVEIRLAGPSDSSSRAEYAGYLVVDERLRELPIGSSFDPERGAFYWQPGLGYVGDYDFVFIRTLADGTRERIPVRITLEGQPMTRFAETHDPWRRIEFSR